MGDLKATPGPWSVREDGCIVGPKGGHHFLKVASPWIESAWNGDDEAIANAHLMASAPELYEALSTVMIALDEYRYGGDNFPAFPEWEDAAISALAKARGEHPQYIREGVDRG